MVCLLDGLTSSPFPLDLALITLQWWSSSYKEEFARINCVCFYHWTFGFDVFFFWIIESSNQFIAIYEQKEMTIQGFILCFRSCFFFLFLGLVVDTKGLHRTSDSVSTELLRSAATCVSRNATFACKNLISDSSWPRDSIENNDNNYRKPRKQTDFVWSLLL